MRKRRRCRRHGGRSFANLPLAELYCLVLSAARAAVASSRKPGQLHLPRQTITLCRSMPNQAAIRYTGPPRRTQPDRQSWAACRRLVADRSPEGRSTHHRDGDDGNRKGAAGQLFDPTVSTLPPVKTRFVQKLRHDQSMELLPPEFHDDSPTPAIRLSHLIDSAQRPQVAELVALAKSNRGRFCFASLHEGVCGSPILWSCSADLPASRWSTFRKARGPARPQSLGQCKVLFSSSVPSVPPKAVSVSFVLLRRYKKRTDCAASSGADNHKIRLRE